MSYQATDIHGTTRLRPDHAQMVRIVNELYAEPPDVFEEVTMTHSSGTSISLYANGTAVLDEPEQTHYALLKDLSRSEQLTLWLQIAAGNLRAIRRLDWIPQGSEPEH